MKRAALILFGLLTWPLPNAHAQCTPGVPSIITSVMPTSILMAGAPISGNTQTTGTFGIHLHDDCNNSLGNRLVRVDLSGCGDLAFSYTQNPGIVADCDLNTATFSTTSAGGVFVALRGYVKDFANASVAGCAIIYAENLPGQTPEWVNLGSVPVAVLDLDGANGFNTHDLINFRCDLFNGQARQRSDYNFDGSLTLLDGSVLAARFFDSPFKSSAIRCDGGTADFSLLWASGTAFNIRWDDCGSGGSGLKTWACSSNSGVVTDHAVVSVISSNPPPPFYGVEAAFEIIGDEGLPIVDWWRMEPGGCSGERLRVAGHGGAVCPDAPFAEAFFKVFQYPAQRIDRETFTATLWNDNPTTLEPGVETALFGLSLGHTKTTGTGSCVGCNAHVNLRLAFLKFLTAPPCAAQPDLTSDYVTLTSDYSGLITWQGAPQKALIVTSANPAKVGQAPQTLSIQGALFASGATVLLRRSGYADIPGNVQSVASVNGLSMMATFDLTGAAVGLWDIVVTNPDLASASKSQALEIVAPIPAKLKAILSGTTTHREGGFVTQIVNFWNTGNVTYDGHAWFAYYVPAGIPSVNVTWAGKAVGTFTPVTMGSRAFVGIFSVPNRPDLLAPYTFKFTAPAIGTYESQLELFQVSGPFSAPLPIDAMGTVANALIAAQAVAQGKVWPSFGAGFQSAFPAALDDALYAKIVAFSKVSNPNAVQARQAKLLEAAVEAALATLNSAYASDVLAYRSIWDPLRTTPADWAAFQNGLPATAAGLPSPPRPSTCYPTSYSNPFRVIASADPNDKSGPAGVGDQHDIAAGTPLPYFIHFENLPTATAAAQLVTVDDQLDGTVIDLSTLSLSTITFGDHVLQPPPGLQSYTEDVDLQPGHNLIARVTATFDPETGALSWRFRSLDPVTLAPTEDPLEGFLPPNGAAGEGEGSVSFTVMPKAANPDATVYSNFARIVFDTNAHIDTPTWTNRLDLSAPSSAVTGLTPTQGTLSFQVSWSGTDAYSGIGSFSVYVSDNGGPYSAWQSNVTTTSATFTGVGGHSYAFYSVATDRIGNVELAPGAPDASTSITVGVEGSPMLPKHLALRMLGGHPSRGSLRVEMALPRSGAGKIEVLDVAGRVVVSRDISRFGAGWHPLTLDQGGHAPGLYLIRITQGAEVVTLKAIYLR